MSIPGKVKDFIETCPFLKEFEMMMAPVVNMNLLDENPTMYSIEETPVNPILKRYTNGDTLRQYVFSFCSRELYEPVENLETAGFYEKFADWLEECTENNNLPQLSGKLESKEIKAVTNGYLYDNQGLNCQYRIQCQFIYYKRR